VVRPGIVRLRAGARVVDAIDAAGGARPDADLDRLNLAAKVADGQRVAVGLPGQPVPTEAAAGTGASADGGAAGAATGPLDLNTATQAQIEELPGIGPVLGAAILRERDRRGGFRSVDDLRSVRGIGEKRFAELRELVTV
jgi:competence protein ComEA